jgi:hypothetical protein
MLESFIEVERKAGKPIPWRDGRVTVWSRVVRVHFPMQRGGLIWNRPVAVSLSTAGEGEQTLPIHDVTRRAQLWLFAAGLLGALGLAAMRMRAKARPVRSMTKPIRREQPKEVRQ